MAIIVLKKGDMIYVTTEEDGDDHNKTYIYLSNRNGKIEIAGNSSIVSKISGYGMKSKVAD